MDAVGLRKGMDAGVVPDLLDAIEQQPPEFDRAGHAVRAGRLADQGCQGMAFEVGVVVKMRQRIPHQEREALGIIFRVDHNFLQVCMAKTWQSGVRKTVGLGQSR
jgi:hypothetical protein